jgi:hypothetical protein
MILLTIGRDPVNNIVLNDPRVSRYHAQLTFTYTNEASIKDLESENGTIVNGARITDAQLKPGDIVQCGNTILDWEGYKKNPEPDHDGYFKKSDEPLLLPDEVEDSVPGLGKFLHHIFFRVHETGLFFKSEWNRTPAILFFWLTPIFLLFLIFLEIHGKQIGVSFSKDVLSPLGLSVFIFGITQFLTLSMLTAGSRSSIGKNLLAGTVLSFLGFLPILIFYTLSLNPSFLGFLGNYVQRFNRYDSYTIYTGEIILFRSLVVTAILFLIVAIFLTHLLFTNVFFKSVGVKRGVALHFTLFYNFINLALRVIFIYAWYRIMENAA